MVACIAAAFAACRTPPIRSADPPRDAAPIVPLIPDPGPASASPLPQELSSHAARDRDGVVRAIVDLRERVDLGALMASQGARGLDRFAARRETRSALQTVAARGAVALAAELEAAVAGGDVAYVTPLTHRNAVLVEGRLAAFERLHGDPRVARIEPEYDSVREARRAAGSSAAAMLAPAVPPGDSWGVEALSLRALWSEGIDGRGTVVASLDSGVIGSHVAFVGKERAGGHWYDPVQGSTSASDTVPHGSQVLSCAVGNAVEGRAIGVAPGAAWAAALSNQFNSYNNINTALAVEWLIVEVEPDVVLGAWGHGKASCDPRDRIAIEVLRATGVVPVFAAGNDGPSAGSVQAPAGLAGYFPEDGGPLVVAAVDRHLAIVELSSRGPSPCGATRVLPDVAAPGWNVPVPAAGKPTSLTVASGTSMSVGWVGGVAALMLQARPELPVIELERIVRATARDLGPTGPDDDFGYGLVDPRAAVDAARAWKPGQVPGTATSIETRSTISSAR